MASAPVSIVLSKLSCVSRAALLAVSLFIIFLLCTIFFPFRGCFSAFPRDEVRAPQQLPLSLSRDNAVIDQNAVWSYCRANFVFDPWSPKNLCDDRLTWKRLAGVDRSHSFALVFGQHKQM
jgi:hypothetical protein